MAMFKSYVKLPEGNMLSNVTLHLCKLEEHIQFRLNWHGSRMLWNCRHFSMCSENVHAKHRGWAWHPEQTSSASVGCSWWLFSDKTWRYPEENWWNIFSNHKKKQHYMKFIFNQRSRKNTQLNHSEVCFFLPAPAISVHHKDCLSSSTMRACSACGKLNRSEQGS